MRVRCLGECPNQEQIEKLGAGFYREQAFHVSAGKEYAVFGLEFAVNAKTRGTGAWIEIISDYGHLGGAPLCLFEVLDPRVSRFWELREWPDGITLWPPSFYRRYYHDDLSENVPEVMQDFRRVRAEIESEFAGPTIESDPLSGMKD